MTICKICIAGLGNVGAHVVSNLSNNKKYISDKKRIEFEIVGISAKNKKKKRIFDHNKFKWYDDPFKLIHNSEAHIFIELIGTENGLSYELIKKALNNKVHVVTANKALLAKHGNELFNLAEQNNVLLLFEAAVAGGIPIIKAIKNSLFLNKINKISGILNGTSNYILTQMYNNNLKFLDVLKKAKANGYAELNPKNDIEGIDSAHKLTILAVLCFGIKFNFKNVIYKGISKIGFKDILFAKKLGYKIKLICSTEIIDSKIISIVEPTLVKINSRLANVEGVQNGIKIETDHSTLFFEGEGAGGQATASSVISDLLEITNKSDINSLGYNTNQLKDISVLNYNQRSCSYYLKIVVKDIPGVLAKITTNLNQAGISIETILQLPENNSDNYNEEVPIIITTHETTSELLNKALKKIEDLDFVSSKIIILSIDKNIN